jgi:hypothetical protein
VRSSRGRDPRSRGCACFGKGACDGAREGAAGEGVCERAVQPRCDRLPGQGRPAQMTWLPTRMSPEALRVWAGEAAVLLPGGMCSLADSEAGRRLAEAAARSSAWSVTGWHDSRHDQATQRDGSASALPSVAPSPVSKIGIGLSPASGRPDLNRRPLDPQECIREPMACPHVGLRRSGCAQASAPERIRAPLSKKRSRLRSHL